MWGSLTHTCTTCNHNDTCHRLFAHCMCGILGDCLSCQPMLARHIGVLGDCFSCQLALDASSSSGDLVGFFGRLLQLHSRGLSSLRFVRLLHLRRVHGMAIHVQSIDCVTGPSIFASGCAILNTSLSPDTWPLRYVRASASMVLSSAVAWIPCCTSCATPFA